MFPVVSGRCVFGSFVVAPGLGATGFGPPPDLGSGAGSLARVQFFIFCLVFVYPALLDMVLVQVDAMARPIQPLDEERQI